MWGSDAVKRPATKDYNASPSSHWMEPDQSSRSIPLGKTLLNMVSREPTVADGKLTWSPRDTPGSLNSYSITASGD
jgi:hypothetical protein